MRAFLRALAGALILVGVFLTPLTGQSEPIYCIVAASYRQLEEPTGLERFLAVQLRDALLNLGASRIDVARGALPSDSVRSCIEIQYSVENLGNGNYDIGASVSRYQAEPPRWSMVVGPLLFHDWSPEDIDTIVTEILDASQTLRDQLDQRSQI